MRLFLLKTLAIACLFFITMVISYELGRYDGGKFKEFEKCQQQLHDEIISETLPSLKELRGASFDVAYKYALGHAYECAFLRNIE
jgi:hypothetical protein